MDVMYQIFICNKCRKEFIALNECINDKTDFMVCTYCGCRSIKRTGKYTYFNKCMEHSSYTRDKGAIKRKK